MKFLKIIRYAILCILISVLLMSCTYVRRALVYWTADIDDYRFFKNREIANGEHQAWPVSTFFNSKSLTQQQSLAFINLRTVAFLVVQNDSICHEEYWDSYTPYSTSGSFSMAKSFISLLVGCAMEDGKITSIDQKVGDFIPEFKEGENAKLTIRHVLMMSTGLNWKERYYNPFNKTTRAYYGTNLNRLLLSCRVTEEPGTSFRYLSGNTQLLAMIVEKATGKNISDYFSEKIWKHIGARNPALWSLDHRDGTEKAFCCFNSNAQDFARIGQLVLQKGKWKGVQLVPEKWITESTSPAAGLKDQNGKEATFYGYQWWLMKYKGHQVICAIGLNGQYIFIIPDKKAVIVRLGEREAKSGEVSDMNLWLDAGLERLK